MRTALERFNRNIIDSTKRFGRWWDGFCKVFEETVDKDTSEKNIKYTFFDDVNHNPVVSQISLELVSLIDMIRQKFTMYSERILDKTFKTIYDKQQLLKMSRSLEKSGQVKDIEEKIMRFKDLERVQIASKQPQVQNFLVLVDYTKVIGNASDKVKEWTDSLGKVLTDIAVRDLNQVINETHVYDEKLKSDV